MIKTIKCLLGWHDYKTLMWSTERGYMSDGRQKCVHCGKLRVPQVKEQEG